MGLGTSCFFITSGEKSSSSSTDGGVSRGSADWARICCEWSRKYPSGLCERLSIDEPISTTTWRGLSNRGEEEKVETKEEIVAAETLARLEEKCHTDEEEDEEDSDASEDQSEAEGEDVLEGVLQPAGEERSVVPRRSYRRSRVGASRFVDDSAMEQ